MNVGYNLISHPCSITTAPAVDNVDVVVVVVAVAVAVVNVVVVVIGVVSAVFCMNQRLPKQ